MGTCDNPVLGEEKNLDILVIGSGGREHALVWKLAQGSNVDKIYAIPGNPGIKNNAECISDIAIDDNKKIVDFARRKNIGLTVIGPEVPLINGLVDDLQAADIAVFGPTKAAARLEGSKSFSKDIMRKYKIPTAAYESFTDAAAAKEWYYSKFKNKK